MFIPLCLWLFGGISSHTHKTTAIKHNKKPTKNAIGAKETARLLLFLLLPLLLAG